MSRRRKLVVVAAAAAVAWLCVAVPLLDCYGPTWDCTSGEYPFGESLLHALTSDASLREAPLHATFGATRAPHPDFALEQSWWTCWPVAATLSAASCRLFWSELGWLPAMAAHHLPIVAMVALLVMAMVVWTGARAGLWAALLAPLLLLTSPRFLADSFNNLKDVPEAVLFTGALLVAARAIRGGGRGAWLLAGSLGGAALAQKTNAIFLPIELLAWLLLCQLLRLPVRDGGERRERRGVALALFAFVAVYCALSPQFWFDPLERLRLHWGHVLRIGNVAVRAAEFGNDSLVARLKIDPDALLQVVWTTPIPVLLLFVVGLLAPTLPGRDRALLLTAAVLPIARSLAPGMVNFDGVRHFDEFFPPMCLLAASGLAWLARLASRAARGARSSPPRAGAPAGLAAAAAAAIVTLVALVPGAWATLASHPNGCAWFNALVGGLRGAQERDVRDATDYWAGSYWQAAAWLDDHAEPGARLFAPIAGHVLRAIAPVRLRADLRFSSLDDTERGSPLYLLYVTRRLHYDDFTRALDATHLPIHEIEVDGAPIVRIHRLAPGGEAGAALAALRTVRIDTLVRQSIAVAWSKATPDAARQIRDVVRRHAEFGHDESLRRLRGALPPELAAEAEAFLRLLEADAAPSRPRGR